MTINYVDLVDGNDSTGTGAWDAPYLTIDKGCDGLSGGDEVRVEKSGSHSSLTGFFTLTNGSTSVNTSSDQTSALAQYDHIQFSGDLDWIWYEVASVSSSVVTLREKYQGATRTTSAEEMVYIDAGDLAISENYQQNASDDDGTSKSSRLKISGGWTLSASPTQDGITYIKQTGTGYEGYGIDVDGSYVEISNFRFYRFRSGINEGSAAFGNKFDNIVSGDTGNAGFYIAGLHGEHGTLYATMSQASIGVYFLSKETIADKVVAFYCDDPPIQIAGRDLTVKEIEVYGVTGTTYPYALYFTDNNGDVVRIGKVKIRNLDASQGSNIAALGSSDGKIVYIGELDHDGDLDYIYYFGVDPPINVHIGKFIGGEPGTAVVRNLSSAGIAKWPPLISIQQWGNDVNDSRMYWNGDIGKVVKDSTDARSDYCLKVTPVINTNEYLMIPIGAFRVTDRYENVNLKVYLKDDSSFNGTIELAAFSDGAILCEAGWAEKTPTTSYVQHTVYVSWRDVSKSHYVELWARITGTAGNCFFDDFDYNEFTESSTTTTTTTTSTTTTTTTP